MRLAQIARELQISPKQIVKHLEKSRGLILENGLNEKLEDDVLNELRSLFKVAEIVEVVEEDWSIQEQKEEPVEELVESLSELEGSIEFEEQIPENPEHIKAIIPDLEGIKVVGKIDLPEPKVVEIEEPVEVASADSVAEPKADEVKAEKPVKREVRPKREIRKRPARAVISDEEKEARAETRRLKDKELAEAKKKEARRLKYLNSVDQKSAKSKIKSPASSKKPRNVETAKASSSATISPSTPTPTKKAKQGFLKKAFRWLYNGE